MGPSRIVLSRLRSQSSQTKNRRLNRCIWRIPTWPAGKIKQVDWAKDGMDVMVNRIIKYADGRVKENKFVSKYRPWQAV